MLNCHTLNELSKKKMKPSYNLFNYLKQNEEMVRLFLLLESNHYTI